MHTFKNFIEICKKHFSYLESDYEFKLAHKKKDSWGFELCFKNQTTGVTIIFELRECRIFVKISQLIEGKFVKDPGEIRPETLLHNYYLDTLLLIRSPESIFPSHQLSTKLNSELIDQMISVYASSLKIHAEDILKGNFSIFSKLDKLVKVNAKEAALKKWGKDAYKYGW